MTHRQTRLVDIADFNPAPPRTYAEGEDEVAFVPMAAVSECGEMNVAAHKMASDLSNGYSYFQRGDVVVSKITPCYENNKIAIASIDRKHGFGSTEFHVIRPHSGSLDARYLMHFLRQDAVREAGKKRMTGSAGQRRVPRQFLEQLEIPLPPLDEQQRVVAVLDHADDLRRKRHETLTALDDLGHATFFDLFGDPVSNPKNWDQNLCLGDVADLVSGITKGRKLNGCPTREVPYLAVANVQDKALNLNAVKTIEATTDEISRYRLMKDDLLLTEGGDPDKLGRGTLWNDEIDECIHQNHIFRVRLHSDRIHPVFLNWLVGSPRGKSYFLKSAKQTTGIASINMTQLRGFPLLAPPYSLQAKFAEWIAQIDKLKSGHTAHLETLEVLFASLQHRAFRGEL